MSLMVLHSADGTDEAALGAGGIDADHVHDFACVKAAMGTVDVLKWVFFDIACEWHANRYAEWIEYL